MIPLLGPSNLRDGIAKVADVQLSPLHFLKNVPVRNSLTGTRLISTRANLLDETNLLDEASLDAYAFMRDAYIQRLSTRQLVVVEGQTIRISEHLL